MDHSLMFILIDELVSEVSKIEELYIASNMR